MPRGKYTNHKGRNRRFTNPDELEEERRRDEEKRKWREQHGSESEEDGSGDSESDKKGSSSNMSWRRIGTVREGSDSSSDDSSDDSGAEEVQRKAKGVSNLIEIQNPNRVQKKSKKVAELRTDNVAKPELSRKEREEIEKQRERAYYQKLHAEGRTDEARADLARLAIIKQQREEAKLKRDAELKEKEIAAKEKVAEKLKAGGRRT